MFIIINFVINAIDYHKFRKCQYIVSDCCYREIYSWINENCNLWHSPYIIKYCSTIVP